MTFHPAGTGSLSAFVLIVVAVIGAVVAGVYVANRRMGRRAALPALAVAAGIAAWVGLTSAVVAIGWVAASPVPRLMVFFGVVNLAGLVFALSPIGGVLSRGLPLGALVGFQAFRLPLELVLHEWARQGVIPGTMTWTGANFDIATGLLAVVAAPLAGGFRVVAWAFNLLGLALLLNVMRVAMMSSPLPFAWDVRPPLQLVLHLPYAWIAPACVAGALAGHVVLTRALLAKGGV